MGSKAAQRVASRAARTAALDSRKALYEGEGVRLQTLGQTSQLLQGQEPRVASPFAALAREKANLGTADAVRDTQRQLSVANITGPFATRILAEQALQGRLAGRQAELEAARELLRTGMAGAFSSVGTGITGLVGAAGAASQNAGIATDQAQRNLGVYSLFG